MKFQGSHATHVCSDLQQTPTALPLEELWPENKFVFQGLTSFNHVLGQLDSLPLISRSEYPVGKNIYHRKDLQFKYNITI